MIVKNFSNWMDAVRLRTLPLSISGIILSGSYAYFKGFWSWPVFIFALLTTILFQITSNLANDYGDAIKGTDNKDRIGPARTVQSGKISAIQMRKAILITTAVSLITSALLIYFGTQGLPEYLIFFYGILAILCIIAAITYTIGKKAYGYYGLGDLMVFIFFGGVSVLGSFPLFAKVFDWNLVYASISIGLFSTAVLNLNNMRDRTNDAQSNKRTLVVMMGPNAAKLYHFFLVCGGIAFLTIFIGKTNHEMAGLGLLPSVLFIFHSRKVMQTKNPKEYDQELKKIALYTFLSSALTALGLLLN